MAQDILFIDYETFCHLDLRQVGASAYSRHPTAEVLMAAFALNEGPVEQWVPAEGEPIPRWLDEAMDDPEVVKSAWNAPFEITITKNTLGRDVDYRQWRCSMTQALHCSLPGSLEKAGEVVGIPVEKQKDKRGKLLMRTFSFKQKPIKADPNRTRIFWHQKPKEWLEYLAYNRADVEAERAIARRLRKYDMGPEEWELFWLDLEINHFGIPINRAMVENAIRIYNAEMRSSRDRMEEITGLDNPNSRDQLLPWLQEEGYFFEDLKKGHIETALAYFDNKPSHWDDDQWNAYQANDRLHEVLSLRAEVSRTSVKKYHALQRAMDDDGRIRGTLQMNAASRTGRWGGRIFQPQNLPRPNKFLEEIQPLIALAIEHLTNEELRAIFGPVFDVLASALRATAQAPDGYLFIDADLNAIENRVLGWLAVCDKILEVFRLKRDPYISFATYLYQQAYDALYHEYKVLKLGAKRQIAKPGTLGSGYGMGPGEVRMNHRTGELEATGLTGYAWNMGIRTFTPEDGKLSIDTFRREFKEVVDLWYDMEKAMKRTIRTGQRTECGFVRFDMEGPFCRMWLPSGRPLYYLRPKIEEKETPWGALKMTITYEGMDQVTKRWGRIKTHGGKIVENADQATSRDLLVHGMKLAIKEGIQIPLHVHDQIVGLVPEDEAEDKLKLLLQCMEEVPSWAPGLPLGAAGHVTKHFIKD